MQQQQISLMTLRNKDVNSEDASQLQPQRAEHNIKFYEEYRKIFATGYFLSQQLRQLISSKEDLWKRLLAYQKRTEEEFKDKMRKEAPERKKRFRRTAGEIQKTCKCEVPRCNRSYGSEGSLLQHIKLKHPQKYDQALKMGKQKAGSESAHDSIFE